MLPLYCILCVSILSVTSEAHKGHGGSFQNRIEGILQDLLTQEWGEEEKPCFFNLINILQSVKNHTLWASYVWDSIQSPTGVLYGSKYQLGNLDECINTPWLTSHPELRTQYCLAEIRFSDEKVGGVLQKPYSSLRQYINSQNEVKFNTMTWSICVPESCQPRSAAKFVKSMLRDSYFEFALPDTNITVNFCQKDNDELFSLTFYYFVIFSSITLIAVLISTAYFILSDTKRNISIGREVAKSLCVFENTSELVRTRDSETLVINGIRCLNSFAVIFYHVWFLSNYTGYSNALYIKKAMEKYKVHLFYHIEIVVDTFFVMSGLLLMKSLLAGKTFNPGRIIVKRYFRLVYVMAVVIFFAIATLELAASGPLQPDIIKDTVTVCKRNWWLNLLTLNNYVNSDKSCHPVTWYVPCDFHLTILGTMLFWLYQKHRRAAVVSYFGITIASIVFPALATYNGQPLPIGDFNIEIARTKREGAIIVPSYTSTHYRAAPYLIGFGFAFLVKTFNLEARSKIISKKWSMVGIFTALLVFTTLIVISGSFYQREYNILEAVIYVGVSKTVWALAICLLIAVCEYGDAPLITSFLGSSVFVPLSKLSYGLYLIHVAIIEIKNMSSRNPLQLDFFVMILDTMGVIVLSYGLSYVFWLLFEAPMNNIVALVLRRCTGESRYTDANAVAETKHPDASHEKKSM